MKIIYTVILYSLLGIISIVLSYTIFSAAKLNSYIPGSEYQGILMFVAASLLLMSILFFVPVATGLVILSKKK